MSKRILALVSEDFEDLELWYPVYRLREEGCIVDLCAEEKSHTYHGKYGVPCTADLSFDEVNPDDYDGLLVPGGWAPDKLRRFPKVIEITKAINAKNKVIGQICHAGWVLISADILKGKKVTSTPGIKDDVINAGATWVDEESVVDGNIVSGRRPPDLPAYMKAYIRVLNAQG
ncbi:MAG: type 1 glutamine amidotransferase [Lachnospiraceae bacterium]|nr:type 1 glutamine amidotransferase [Lachnospiraceae bacterium]